MMLSIRMLTTLEAPVFLGLRSATNTFRFYLFKYALIKIQIFLFFTSYVVFYGVLFGYFYIIVSSVMLCRFLNFFLCMISCVVWQPASSKLPDIAIWNSFKLYYYLY